MGWTIYLTHLCQYCLALCVLFKVQQTIILLSCATIQGSPKYLNSIMTDYYYSDLLLETFKCLLSDLTPISRQHFNAFFAHISSLV